MDRLIISSLLRVLSIISVPLKASATKRRAALRANQAIINIFLNHYLSDTFFLKMTFLIENYVETFCCKSCTSELGVASENGKKSYASAPGDRQGVKGESPP